MSFTVMIPGRRTPINTNNFLKARGWYNAGPNGTRLRNNKTRASVTKFH